MDNRSECKACQHLEKESNENCQRPGPDGLPVQCVGPWAEDKHHYLRQYLEATRAVRKDYLPPNGPGGAAFIDIFAGPGVVRVRDTGDFHDGSPMIAANHEASPFTDLVFCDIDPQNASALRARASQAPGRATVIEGDSNEVISDVMRHVPKWGLNIALVDPFALSALKFSTLAQLASVERMDLVIHFPMGDIKRNLWQHESSQHNMDEALGTSRWRSIAKGPGDAARLIDVFREQLQTLGYGSKDVRAQPIKNSSNVVLYYLVYASKHPRGDAIWKSVTKNEPSGQRGFGF